jgi:hypothetical protein
MDGYPDEKKISCVVLVSSCDAFDDVWYPFFTLFFRYWPDCPFKVYLLNNYKKFDFPGIEVINVGEDKAWASNIIKALGRVKEKYILYLQEDYLFQSFVNNDNINAVIKFAEDKKAGYIRLVPYPPPDIIDLKIMGFSGDLYPGQKIGLIKLGSKYRTSLQAAVWDRETLLELLVSGENGWDMELNGSIRSAEIEQPFFSAIKPVIDYFPKTAIKKGRWYYDAIKLCEREGISIVGSGRPTESFREYLWRRAKNLPFLGFIIRKLHRRAKRIFLR